VIEKVDAAAATQRCGGKWFIAHGQSDEPASRQER